MKTVLLSVLLVFVGAVPIWAGPSLSPEGVIRAAIVAAGGDRRADFVRLCDFPAIASKPKHGMQEPAVIELLKSFHAAEVHFAPTPLKDDSTDITVRMTAPRHLDFDLAGTKQPNGVLWRIVAIHP